MDNIGESKEEEEEELDELEEGSPLFYNTVDDFVNSNIPPGAILKNSNSFRRYNNLFLVISGLFETKKTANPNGLKLLEKYFDSNDNPNPNKQLYYKKTNEITKRLLGIDLINDLAIFFDKHGTNSALGGNLLFMLEVKKNLMKIIKKNPGLVGIHQGLVRRLVKILRRYNIHIKKLPKLEYSAGDYKTILQIILETDIPAGIVLHDKTTRDEYLNFFVSLSTIFLLDSSKTPLENSERYNDADFIKETIGVDFTDSVTITNTANRFKEDEKSTVMKIVQISYIKSTLIGIVDRLDEKTINSNEKLTGLIDEAIGKNKLFYDIVVVHKRDKIPDDISYTDIEFKSIASDVINGDTVIIDEYINSNRNDTIIIIKVVDQFLDIQHSNRSKYFVYTLDSYEYYTPAKKAVGVVFPCLEANGYANTDSGEENLELDKPLLSLDILFKLPGCISLKDITFIINKQIHFGYKIIGVLITRNANNNVPSISKFPYVFGSSTLNCNRGFESVHIWDVHEISNIDEINSLQQQQEQPNEPDAAVKSLDEKV